MNDAHPFATRVNAQLPGWLVTELHLYNTLLPSAEARVGLTNRLAARNHKEGNGGPFAAIVVDHATGELISLSLRTTDGSFSSKCALARKGITSSFAYLEHLGSESTEGAFSARFGTSGRSSP